MPYVNNCKIHQMGLSDVERQAMQQKIQAEIQAKKEQHLTVYQKSSVDHDEDEAAVERADLKSTQTEIRPAGGGGGGGGERGGGLGRGPSVTSDGARPSARALKGLSQASDSDSEADENDVEAAEEAINRLENFKVLHCTGCCYSCCSS